MDAERPVAGIRISREAGTTVRSASYLPADSAVFCRFLSSRKVNPGRLRRALWMRRALRMRSEKYHSREPLGSSFILACMLLVVFREWFICSAWWLKGKGQRC
jgi:hypothetical protein